MVNCDGSDKPPITSKPSDKTNPPNAKMRWQDAGQANNTAAKSTKLKSSSVKTLRNCSNALEETNVEEYIGDSLDSSNNPKKMNSEKSHQTSEPSLEKPLNNLEEEAIGEEGKPSTRSDSGHSGDTCGNEGDDKPKPDLRGKRRSEIPKLKSIIQARLTNQVRARAAGSKLPVKTAPKEPEQKPLEVAEKTETLVKKDRTEERVRQAMKQDFPELLRLYEKGLKKITDFWVNTIYCSLTLRANLVKLLFHAFPNINKSQFHMEDERLLFRIAHAKYYTKSEADNLVEFVKALLASREKAKESYAYMKANKEIAEFHNYDWRGLTRKIADLRDEIQQYVVEAPELLKKKDALEAQGLEKLQKLECYVHKKAKEIKKFENQLAVLRQRELSYKGGIFLKLEDYKEIKGDVLSLKDIEKHYKELQTKYKYQNEEFEKQIKALEHLLEEKQEILEREKAGKEKLQRLLVQMQENKRELSQTIGKEQADYFLGGSVRTKIKKRELLWVAAVKLVLKGFLMQVNKLERDKNKMLLELQSNNIENFVSLATSIVHKENFIESIKQQMITYQKACKQEVSYVDDV